MSNDREAETAAPRIPARLFLNYASEDREHAVWLRERLLEAGMATHVWLDCDAIEGGERWKQAIDDGLRDATVLLALLTKNSLNPKRRWIKYERKEAQRLLRPIVPLRFEAGVRPPKQLGHLHYIDFAGDREAALSALREVLDKLTLRYTSREPLLSEPPPAVNTFVGREDEIQRLFALIDTPRKRVATARQAVAIQGMGGQGKTMLAEELVRRIAVRYPGGLIIERRGAQGRAGADKVLQDWARLALGDLASGDYGPAQVCSLLGKYGQLLVLIDDVSESDFGEVLKLLEALPPDATRLITTRSLNVKSLGCVMFELSSLSDEDARAMVRDRLRAMSGASKPRKESAAQAEAIRRLVELVDGHALALELAVAGCDVPQDLPRAVDRLAAGLAEGLDDMEADLTEKPTPRDSVAVSLNISLEHLREHDRAKQTTWAERFAALGVFPDSGRMSDEMIATVWGDAGAADPHAVAALSGIYRRAMIRREPDGDLYNLHPLLRALARSLLKEEPGRMAAAQLRYRDFLTRAAEKGFSQPEDQWSSMRLYTPHLLYTAAELWQEWTLRLRDLDALSRPEPPEAPVTLADPEEREAALRTVRFVQALMDYVLRRPALGEDGRRLLKLGLACVRASGSDELLDTFVRALGVWCARSDLPAAERYFEQALRLAEETGDRAELGKVYSYYGELERNRSMLDRAVELLGRALEIHERLGDERMQAVTHKSLGDAQWRLCDFDSATNHYQRARALYDRLEDRSGEADILNKLGCVEFNRGNYEAAIAYFQQALPLHREVENRSMEGEDLNDMGIAYNYLRKYDEALPRLEQAVEIHNQLGNRRLEAVAMSNRAAAFYAKGRLDPRRYEDAVREARNAAAIAREVECKFTQVWSLNWEALAQQELGRPDLARPLLEQAEELLKKMGGPRERVTTWGNLGYLLGKHCGQRDLGLDFLKRAIELMRANRFECAFGGRTMSELEAQLAEISL